MKLQGWDLQTYAIKALLLSVVQDEGDINLGLAALICNRKDVHVMPVA